MVLRMLDSSSTRRIVARSSPVAPSTAKLLRVLPSETERLCLDRNLIVISIVTGGRDKGPSLSYSRKRRLFCLSTTEPRGQSKPACSSESPLLDAPRSPGS